MTHELKILPIYFKDVSLGPKRFELRKLDRPYKVGDTLVLKEWNEDQFTGQFTRVRVTYILEGPKYGLAVGYGVLGFKMLSMKVKVK